MKEQTKLLRKYSLVGFCTLDEMHLLTEVSVDEAENKISFKFEDVDLREINSNCYCKCNIHIKFFNSNKIVDKIYKHLKDLKEIKTLGV